LGLVPVLFVFMLAGAFGPEGPNRRSRKLGVGRRPSLPGALPAPPPAETRLAADALLPHDLDIEATSVDHWDESSLEGCYMNMIVNKLAR
jgi:hypothetical protein